MTQLDHERFDSRVTDPRQFRPAILLLKSEEAWLSSYDAWRLILTVTPPEACWDSQVCAQGAATIKNEIAVNQSVRRDYDVA